MNRITNRRAGSKTDICLMAGCSVVEIVFLILIIFKTFIKVSTIGNIARGTTDPGYCLFN